MDFLLSNPEQSCWVLDGYDEFNSRLIKHDMQTEPLDPETPLSVAELMSGLLHGQLLPGCTVLVTCRLRDVVDLEEVSFKVGQLLGWGHHEIKEYVDSFFRCQGKFLYVFTLYVHNTIVNLQYCTVDCCVCI